MSRPLRERKDRPVALTTPAVTVCSKPSGLPMAIASCPGLMVFESCSSSDGAEKCPSVRITAISVSGSSPTMRAAARWPSGNETSIALAPLTTWLLVKINPSDATTKPEPVPPRPLGLRMAIWTTPGPAFSTAPITARE